MLLPDNISYGRVVGKFIHVGTDSDDEGRFPDGIAATGSITFTPSAKVLVNATSDPPVTIVAQPIECSLNDYGVLVDSEGEEGVYLIATDDDDLRPVDWTYSVRIQIAGTRPVIFDIAVPTDSVIDLSDVMPVEPSAGVPALQAAVAAAQTAAENAALAVFTWRGEWSAGDYELRDLVEHDGTTWVATEATSAEPPSAPWEVFAARGEQGPQGDTGDPGVVQAVVGGTGIEVDSTDAANPVVAVEPSVLTPGVICSDSLARADGALGTFDNAYGGSAAPATWEHTGHFVLDSGEVALDGSVSFSAARAVEAGRDVEVSTRVKALSGTTNSGAGLGVRMEEVSNSPSCQYLRLNSDGSVSIMKRTGSSNTVLASSSAGVCAVGDILTLRAIGRHLVALVNGVAVVDVIDTDIPTGRWVGYSRMGNDAARFDQFVARDLGPGMPPGSAGPFGVVQVIHGAEPVSIDSTNPAEPVVSVDAATDSDAGVVELATEAETVAGTDATRAVTPSGLVSVRNTLAPRRCLRPSLSTGNGLTLSEPTSLTGATEVVVNQRRDGQWASAVVVSNSGLFGDLGGGGGSGWYLTTAKVLIVRFADGTNANMSVVGSGSIHLLDDYEWLRFRATADDGSGRFASVEGSSDGSHWTTIAQVTGSALTPAAPSTVPWRLAGGGTGIGSKAIDWAVAFVSLRDGFDGPVVASWDANAPQPWVEPSGLSWRLIGSDWSWETMLGSHQSSPLLTDTGLRQIGLYEWRGSGFPSSHSELNDVPIGSTYTDRDATNGALTWHKAAAGSSGWVVDVGDTGLCPITAWTSGGVVSGQTLSASWGPRSGVAGGVWVRRTGNILQVDVLQAERIGGSNAMWDSYVLPTGLRPVRDVATLILGSGGVQGLKMTTSGTLIRPGSPDIGDNGHFERATITAICVSGWPATLPTI